MSSAVSEECCLRNKNKLGCASDDDDADDAEADDDHADDSSAYDECEYDRLKFKA